MPETATQLALANAAIHFHDVDDLNHAVSGSDLELVQLQPGTLDVTLLQVPVGDLSVDVGTVNLPLRARGGLDAKRFSLGAYSPGSRGTWNGHCVDASQLLVFSPGAELDGYLSKGYGWTSFVIPPAWIESIAETTSCSKMPQLASSCLTLRPHPQGLADLWQAIAHIVARAESPVDVATADWLTSNFRNALGAALFSLDDAPVKVMSRALAHFSLARRAERYLREHIAEPICIDDLCVAMRASRRYLEYAFSDAFGTSPSRYLRLLRLHLVRRNLRALGARTSVTEEALRLGFNHLGLFSIQYKKAFGESPSNTVAQAAPPAARRRAVARGTSVRADCR